MRIGNLPAFLGGVIGIVVQFQYSCLQEKKQNHVDYKYLNGRSHSANYNQHKYVNTFNAIKSGGYLFKPYSNGGA
jgi:hypothetical protein